MEQINVDIDQPNVTANVTSPNITASIDSADVSADITTTNVEANISAATVSVNITGGGQPHTIQDEGVPLTDRSNLNFVGSAVTVTDDSANNATVVTVSAGGGAWGTITGTLSDQTDLQTALNNKADATHTHPLSQITQSGASTNNVPKWNGSAWAPASDDKTFLQLTDTPASYSGQATKALAVNSGETAVEFVTMPTGLPAGASTNTLRHNGTAWVADSLLQNSGTEVTIARTNTTGTPFKVTIPISAVNYNILAHTYNSSGGQNSLLTVSSSTIGSNAGFAVTNNTTNALGAPRMQFIRRRGTLAAPSDAASGDLVGRFDFRVRNGGSDQAATTFFGGVLTDTTYNGASIFFATSTVDFNQLKFLAHTNGAIGIGNFGTPGAVSAPNASAALEIRSTVGSFLLPRMTTAQRDALATPEDGMMVYNTTDNKFQGRASGAWVDLH